MEREAKELASGLVSIDVVRYRAGDLGPQAVTVFFITLKGAGKVGQ
jgi:hypothetical protein